MVCSFSEIFDSDYVKSLNAALSIEVFHNFSLVHDDIMDDAPLRRGKETVHEKWNTNAGILSGDAMLIMAYKLFESYDNQTFRALAELFSKTALEVCEGQQYDMNFETQQNITIDDYLKMIELKTAVLLGASLRIGALIAKAPVTDVNHVYAFGQNIGIAFQLMDDLLDVYGNPEKFGKQVGGDIISNKKTYLLLKAKELAKNELKKELEFCLSSKTLSPENKVNRVKAIYSQLKIKELTMNEMNHFYNTAIAHLDSIEVPNEKKLVFEQFAKGLMQREY